MKGNETFEQALLFAFGLEKGSREFYLKAAEKVEDAEAREFFDAMADIELGHMGKLRLIYCTMDYESCPPTLEQFIESVPAPFTEGGKLVTESLKSIDVAFIDRTEAVKVAIRLETDAHSFYNKALKRLTDPFAKVLFKDLAEDEKKHIDDLTRMLKSGA